MHGGGRRPITFYYIIINRNKEQQPLHTTHTHTHITHTHHTHTRHDILYTLTHLTCYNINVRTVHRIQKRIRNTVRRFTW